MSLFPRVRIRAYALHVRNILRAGINAQITQAIAEATGDPPASGLATIANTTQQIEIGDNRDYEPAEGFYPSIRIAAPRVVFDPLSSASVTDTAVTLLIGIYTEQTAGAGECAEDVIQALTETTLDLVECVRATLERDMTSSSFGDRGLVLGYERTDAPQDPETPCKIRIRYEMTFEGRIRARHSRGATT